LKHKGLVIAFVIVALLGFSFIAGMFACFFLNGDVGTGFFSGRAVGVIEVTGPIITSKEIIEEIEKIREDDSIKSVVLRVDSPGGAVAASQEIFEAVTELKKDKPVIASMGTVAASGGYYVSCAATEIFASSGTTTGSIGVRLEHLNIGELMKWAKFDQETIKSGKLKNMFAINKPLSSEAKVVLQSLVDEIHTQFEKIVSESRQLSDEKVKEISDGRIFTGSMALKLGLIDHLGGFVSAVKRAGELGGIDGYPKLVYPKKRRGIVERLFAEAKVLLYESRLDVAENLQPMLLQMSSN
jgi:protease-4